MKILVTGAQGFIGTHLVPELYKNGHEVVAVDHQDGDLRFFKSVTDLLENHHPDHVVHLAAQVGRLTAERDLSFTISNNATATANVAHACSIFGVGLAYVSTSEIYGDQGEKPCHEDLIPSLPHNLYGLTKRWGEEACHLFKPPNLSIIRLSMPYGPGMKPGKGRNALLTFLWQAHYRMPISVYADSERAWCWVGDTVKGIRLVVENGLGPFNVGRDDNPVSMYELAKMACILTDAPLNIIQVVPMPPRITEVKHLPTHRLRNLGWRPTVELEEGLVRTLSWVQGFDERGELKLA